MTFVPLSSYYWHQQSAIVDALTKAGIDSKVVSFDKNGFGKTIGFTLYVRENAKESAQVISISIGL